MAYNYKLSLKSPEISGLFLFWSMFNHQHPYAPFIPEGSTKLIVGTLPPPRFVTKELIDGDVDFCYGSIKGQLWPILDRIFTLNLCYENTAKAIQQRKLFLEYRKLGICDIVESCKRSKIDASDLGMQEIQLRNILVYLRKNKSVNTLLFTGGNSKNGPEYFFRKLLKQHTIEFRLISNVTPRIHEFTYQQRIIKTVSLTAPSGAANRAIGSNPQYHKMKATNPELNTFDFRVIQYREHF